MLKKATFVFASLLITTFVLTQDSFSQAANPQATIENGKIEGENDSGIYVFKGIPFAQPPVDDLRWTAPRDAKSWDGIKQSKTFASGCMQLPVFGDMNFRSDGFSEDCLYLNVWTPTRETDEKLPVLVYFYGGGFIAGDGSEPRYDGASMARNHGIVTVTTNYRLGIFGFFAHPELTEESPYNGSGNYGLLDQAKALQWVKDNIAAFGGDPDNITIAGESAGSISVSAQMASPLSRDLIAGAIGESGSILGALSAVPQDQGEKTGSQFAEKLDANSLEALREIPAKKLLQATGQPQAPRFNPTVDGHFFPKAPIDIYSAGEQASVPLFVGWNSMEMTYQSVMQGAKPTPENYKEKVQSLYGDNADKILELYPGSTPQEVVHSATDLAGDRFIAFSTWKWGNIHGQTSDHPVYRYYYTKPRPPMKSDSTSGQMQEESSENTFSEPEGAVHAAEIEYMMGNLPSNRVYDWIEEDYKVSDIFQNYAANFIKTKNPNGLGLPDWPAVNGNNSPKVIHIGIPTVLKDAQHGDRYRFLDQLQYGD